MEHLVVCMMGENQIDLANELAKAANYSECSILDCHMITMDSEFISNLLVTGSWNALAKFETQIQHLEKKFAIQTLIKRTQPRKHKGELLPYIVYIIGKDQIGIIYQVINFFVEQAIEIRELYSETFTSRQTNITMISLSLSINVPADMLLSDLRERFLVFCDRINLDGILEAEKT